MTPADPVVAPVGTERWVRAVLDVPDAAGGASPAAVLGRRSLVIVDHGTGLGEAVAAVGLDDDAADAVVAAEAAVLGRAPEVRALEPIEVVLRPGADPDLVEVDVTGEGATRHWRPANVPDRLLALLTRRRLDEGRGGTRLHGGAVVDDRERAVLVLGRSGSGKSTLTAHLAHAGLHLLNDEQVTLAGSGDHLSGFTRPLAVKPGGVRHLPSVVAEALDEADHTQLVPAALMGTAHRLTGRPAMVVLPERTPADGRVAGRGRPAPEVALEVVPPIEAVEALCANNLDLEARPVEALGAYAALVSVTPVVRIRYRDASRAAQAIVEHLDRADEVPSLDWTVSEHADEHDPPSGDLDPRRRGPLPSNDTISVEVGGDVVLYHRPTRSVARLNPEGSAVWRSLARRDRPAGEGAEQFLADLARAGFVAGDEPGDEPAVEVRSPVARPASGGGVLRRRPGLVSRRLRDAVMVLDRDGGYSVVDGAAAVAWSALATPGTVDDLVARIAADVDDVDDGSTVAVEALAPEVRRAVDALVEAGLVEDERG